MKRSTAILLGILILLAGIGVLFYAFMPGLAVFTIPLWKWFLAAALVYWIVKKIVSSKSLGSRLSVFLPLGLMFILLEKEIGGFIGKGDDFVNNWFIILAAVLIDVALTFIFRSRISKVITYSGPRYSGSSSAGRSGSGVGEISEDGDMPEFKLGSHVYYVDASTSGSAGAVNKLGELNVYYQNTDTEDLPETLVFTAVNQMGEMRIHIPRDWHVELNSDNSMGSVRCRPDGKVTNRTILINVKNQMGEVIILSDD